VAQPGDGSASLSPKGGQGSMMSAPVPLHQGAGHSSSLSKTANDYGELGLDCFERCLVTANLKVHSGRWRGERHHDRPTGFWVWLHCVPPEGSDPASWLTMTLPPPLSVSADTGHRTLRVIQLAQLDMVDRFSALRPCFRLGSTFRVDLSLGRK
jgi:hypothetical protein